MQYELVHYHENDRDIFNEFVRGLKDKRGQSAIYRRVDRMSDGNFGEHYPCYDGVWELIINFGPGYRVYYSIVGKEIILLLSAGTKRRQQSDIDQAVDYLKKYKERHK